MIEVYKCEVIKEFSFNRKGEIKKFFIYDYEKFKENLKFICKEVLN